MELKFSKAARCKFCPLASHLVRVGVLGIECCSILKEILLLEAEVSQGSSLQVLPIGEPACWSRGTWDRMLFHSQGDSASWS
jgi:hypothetical protein